MTKIVTHLPNVLAASVPSGALLRYLFLVGYSDMMTALTALRATDLTTNPTLTLLVTSASVIDPGTSVEAVRVPLCDGAQMNEPGAALGPFLTDVLVYERGIDGGTFLVSADYACDSVHGITAEMMAAGPLGGWLCIEQDGGPNGRHAVGNYGYAWSVHVQECTTEVELAVTAPPVAPKAISDSSAALAAGLIGLAAGFTVGRMGSGLIKTSDLSKAS